MHKYERNFLECLDLRGVSERTKFDYFRRIKPLEKFYSKYPTTLSIQQIREYFLYLIRVKKLSPATLKSSFFSITDLKKIQIIKQFFGHFDKH